MKPLASLNFSILKKMTENQKEGDREEGDLYSWSDENKQCKQNTNENFFGKNFS